MASISFDENCCLVFKDHAKHLSNSCNESFEQQQFSDVTLAAEDYLFSGHRLVLAAFSPCFQQMLTKVPATQHAIVFLKDVSKQTLYYLMKYIYCGEVSVERDHLNEFFNTAKSLQVKGLIDGNQSLQFSECQSANEMAPSPTIHGFQYQSTNASMRAKTSANMNTSTISIDSATRFYEYKRDINDENDVSAKTKGDTHISDEINEEDQFDGIQNDHFSFEQVKDGPEKSSKRTTTDSEAPTRKRVKQTDDRSKFNTLADIRSMANGRKSLFHNGYKFYAQSISAKSTKIRWLCSRHASKKCNSIINTTDINGKTMMKIVRAEHTHQTGQE